MASSEADGRTLPNFLMIGPGKAGTTWIYELLSGHPDVYVPETKEVLYFNRFHDRGEDWYATFFDGAEGHTAVGEVSNTYIFDSEAPRRIRRYNPAMRLVTSLRNPIDRAFSHYLFLRRNGQVTGSFERVIGGEHRVVERGLYHRYLSEYWEHFPDEQLLVLDFDVLKENPRAFGRAIFEHLGVDPSFWPEGGDERVLGAMEPRSRWMARAAKEAAVWLRRVGDPRWVTRIKQSWLSELLFRPLDRSEYPEVDPATRRKLEDYYREDAERLSRRVGIDFVGKWFDDDG